MKTLLSTALAATLALFVTCSDMSAQATAQISGAGRDQSGAVLPGVEITVTQTDTGVSRSTVTNETGTYVFPNLPIGPYRLGAALPGFRTFVQTGIVLQVNSSPVINVQLEVGQVSENVEVQANAALVETRSTSVGAVIENRRILELPLNGRNVQDLISLAGGAVNVGDGRGTSLVGAQSDQIAVGGGAGYSVDYTLDGANHVSFITGSTMMMPFPDAMQEFKVEYSGVTAQRGRNTAVAAVTKSGTNAFHGSLFEFVRNDQFNARNYFATRKSTLKRNQFGGTAGGPIFKNKLFFFGGLQRTTLRSDPAATRAIIPTPQMLAGDWTTYASAACNNGRPLTLPAPFVNNRIDPAAFSPVAMRLVTNQKPKPFPKNADDSCGNITYSGSADRSNDSMYVGRIDYQMSTNHSVFGRVLVQDYGQINPEKFNTIYLQASGWRESRETSYTIGSTYLIGANAVQAFRFAFNNTANNYRQPKDGFDWCDAGVKIYCEPRIHTINRLVITGGFNVSHGFEDDWRYYGNSYDVNDDLSFVRGSHQIGFGGSYQHGKQENTGITWASQHQWRFSSLANFMLGRAQSLFTGRTNEHIVHGNKFSLYTTDTWKVKPTVTLSYGFRWQPAITPYVLAMYNFDYDRFRQGMKSSVFLNAPTGLFYRGDLGFPKNGVNTRWLQFAPRLGMAWDVNGDSRTSVRASYSLAYIDLPGDFREGFSGGAPWGARLTFTNIGLEDPYRNIPGGEIFPYSHTDPNAPFPNGGLFFTQKYDVRQPYTQSWNLTLERQIGENWLVSGTYMGNNMVHVWTNKPLNPSVYFPGVADANGNCSAQGYTLHTNPGTTCSTLANTETRRRLSLQRPNDPVKFAYLAETDDGGVQQYHGMLLSVQRRARGVTVNANYTWSHCIGPYATLWSPMSDHPDDTYVDPNDRDFDRGNCDSDRRHIFNMTASAETPQFANTAARILASGWRLSTIYKYSAGSPLDVLLDEDRALNGLEGAYANQRPDQVASDVYGKSGPGDIYLKRSAFGAPAIGTFGNLRRNAFRSPASWTFDVALARVFNVRENQTLEFRAEAYNLPNSFRPVNPNGFLTNRFFGEIRDSQSPRILQFALKYIF